MELLSAFSKPHKPFSGLLLHSFQGIVEYGEGSALLALPHQIVHELGHQRIVVLGIRVDDVLFRFILS